MKRLIIGVTGAIGSGSTKITDIISEKESFIHIKISNILKEMIGEEIGRIHQKEQRGKLQDFGNDLRKKEGSGYLVKLAIEKANAIDENKDVIIESIKNPGEIEEIRSFPNGYVIAINAPFEIRWQRFKDKYKGEEHLFKNDDERDKEEKQEDGDILKEGQQVQKCVDMADVYLKNDKQFHTPLEWDGFKKKVDHFLNIFKNPGTREPSILELMMNNAYCMSLRSPCLRRQVGAIITIKTHETEHIISSGYNVTPKGQKPCKDEYKQCYRVMEAYKLKKEKNIDTNDVPGNLFNICRSLHAEESAILQICRIGGTSLNNATLYTTTYPCTLCAKMIAATGISTVVWLEPYPEEGVQDYLHKAKITTKEFEGIKSQSFFKLFKKNLN